MLPLEPFTEDRGRSAVHPARGIPPISFLAPSGFSRPSARTHVRLLGPCFKTGRMGSPRAGARSAQGPPRRHAKAAGAARGAPAAPAPPPPARPRGGPGGPPPRGGRPPPPPPPPPPPGAGGAP